MKPTLVILHGWGLSRKRFDPLISELKKRGYHVFAPDFPGFGDTQLPDNPLTLTDYAQFLKKFLDTNRITNCVLIGHSFGGRVSLRFQSLYPKDVRALILTGTPGYTPVPRKKLLLFIGLAKLGKLVFSLPVLSLFLDKIRLKYYYLVGAREFYRAEGSMRQTFKNIVMEKLGEDMKNATVPTLLLWGENDTIVPVKIAERMHETMRGSKLIIIPGTDHGVPFREPKKFADSVEQFI